MPPRNLNVIFFAAAAAVLCYFTHRRTRHAALVSEAIDLIDQHYVDPIKEDDLVFAAMNGLTSALDQHSSYFPVDAYESFQENIHQEFAGIGIYVDQPDRDAPVRVITPLVDSPALAGGVLPGDRIIRVDEEDVSKLSLREVSAKLKGPPGTSVHLAMRRGEQVVTMTVERAKIPLPSVIGDHRDDDNRWVFRIRDVPDIAYMRLDNFGDKTVDELGETLAQLNSKFKGLVLDLRGNSGGLLTAARDISDMFLEKGMIVSTRTRGGEIELEYAATKSVAVDPGIPMAVLIDGNSASASEIVAASLQDNRRAIVVGTRSYGKGTVQEIMPLQYGRSALRLTVARYYRPNNKNIHRGKDATEEDEWGVTPDDGFLIPMDRPALVALGRRWRESSFPMLVGIESEDESELPPSDETRDSSAEDDVASLDPELQDDSEELTAEAEANVNRGPKSLDFDPPLRAAVGELLRRSRQEIDGDSETELSDESSVKKAA